MKGIILHNVPAPYRVPLFNAITQKHTVRVLFTEKNKKYRKWKVSVEDFQFDYIFLNRFKLGPFVLNPGLLPYAFFEEYDFVIISDDKAAILGNLFFAIIAKLRKKKIIVWSGEIDKQAKGLLHRCYYSFLRMNRILLYKMCSSFVAYSTKTKKYLQNHGAKGRVYKGGQVMPKEILFEGHKSTRKEKIILSLSYLEKRKGVQDLISAFKQVDDQKWRLCIAGSGPYEQDLKKRAGKNKNIIFLGHVSGEKKAEVYSSASVFVLPTRHDPWGLTVNEAVYYGLPVIISDAAGAADLITEHKNGMIYKAKDVSDLAGCLSKMIEDERMQDTFSRRSYASRECTDIERGAEIFFEAINIE